MHVILSREVSEYLQQKSVEQVIDCLFVQDVTGIPVGLLETSRRVVHVNHLVMQKLAGVESIESTEAIGVIKLPSSFCNLESLEIHSSSQIWCSLPHRLLVLDGIQVSSGFLATSF
jgi:TrmH family RNA methyltransferase